MRVVFLGTPALAATILEGLLEGPDEVVGVFSRPDAASGRGLELAAPPVAELARKTALPVLQPKSWRDGSAIDSLRALSPDLVIVAAYGRILPQAALDVPRFGCINVHASLLPRWRGADPIRRAILAGDEETGVTIMGMVLEMDAGPILLQRAIPILADDTGQALEKRLALLGQTALREFLDSWRRGKIKAREQDPAVVTFSPPIKREDGETDFTRPAAMIARATRALAPWPGASARIRDLLLRLWTASALETNSDEAPGSILSIEREGVRIATGQGVLLLQEVQAPGKRRMAAADWARGFRLLVGETFARRAEP